MVRGALNTHFDSYIANSSCGVVWLRSGFIRRLYGPRTLNGVQDEHVPFVSGCIFGPSGNGENDTSGECGQRLRIPLFSIDHLEAALWRSGIRSNGGSHQAAYELLTTLAENQLRLGQSAILDCVAGHERTRTHWKNVAHQCGAKFRGVECICSMLVCTETG